VSSQSLVKPYLWDTYNEIEYIKKKEIGEHQRMLNRLKKFRQDLKKKGKGFTLVELIVVIIIIAVLAAVAIPSLVSFQDTARKARIQSEHRQLVQAVQSYIGSQVEPETADVPDLDALKPYIAKESQGSGELSKTLAADNGKIAHEVNKTSHKLISTYTPASGGKPITWEFDWRSNSAS